MTVYVPGRPDVYLDQVDIRWVEADGPGEWDMPAHYSVSPVWKGVDRSDGLSFSVGTNKALGQRLARAMMAGAVFYDLEVKMDINDQTYVCSRSKVLGRMINADLKRLGF